jgi:hypothetical protein
VKGIEMRISSAVLAVLFLLAFATAVDAQPQEGLYHVNCGGSQVRHFVIYDTGYWYEVVQNDEGEWAEVSGMNGSWIYDPALEILGLFDFYEEEELLWWDLSVQPWVAYESGTTLGNVSNPDPLPPGW